MQLFYVKYVKATLNKDITFIILKTSSCCDKLYSIF